MEKRIKDLAKEHADGTIDDYVEKERYVKVGKKDILVSDYETLKEITAVYGSTPEKEIAEKRVTIDDGRVVKYEIYAGGVKKIPDSISRLSDLDELCFRCDLEEFPEPILELGYLRILEIYNNKITSIPDGIYKLENLKVLELQNNKLEGLPQGLAKMKKLEKIVLSGNKITKLPEGIGSVKTLKHFEMCHSGLSKVPEELVGAKGLEKLYLQFNSITDVSGIESFENLKHLNLMENELESLPESISELKNLEEINITSNSLKTLPEGIWNLENLKKIEAARNNIAKLPDSMDSFKGKLEIYENPLEFSDKKRIMEKLGERVVVYDPSWDNYDDYY
ncbi:MAG: leucine-rich repeat domain-containing protein [Candidatus Aenigmarchaeota archaeon]|nr:leucine-rich repeat domain-containing protein [Candidatus Aenigmarchaeota archaeon]